MKQQEQLLEGQGRNSIEVTKENKAGRRTYPLSHPQASCTEQLPWGSLARGIFTRQPPCADLALSWLWPTACLCLSGRHMTRECAQRRGTLFLTSSLCLFLL